MELYAAYRRGDETAAAKLFHRYSERLIALARRTISPRLAGKVNPESAMMSAFGSFFRCDRAGQYTLRCSGDLWKLLATITVRKVLRQVECLKTEKRQIDREQAGIDEAELCAADPSPEAAAILADELQLLFATLPAVHQQMVQLYLQGWKPEEIAKETGYTATRVRQVLRGVRARAQQRAEELEGDHG
jgi:RNA polymerase sigma factor (sigma-70 family)